MPDRSRLGVSPIIATLLLIVIAVAASVVVYMFVSGMISTSQPSPISVKVSIDGVSSNLNNVTVYARNTGSDAVSIDHVYLEGAGGVFDVPVSPPTSIPAGGVAPISFANTFVEGSYVVKITSAKGVLCAQSYYLGKDPPPVPTDTTPPTVTINSPTNSTYTALGIAINATVTDPSGVSSVLAEVNGGYNVTLVSQGGFYINTTASFAQGANTVRIFASDTLGNMNSAQSVQFSVYTGLSAWWRMDEGAGTLAYDSSPNGNNGNGSGSVWVPGVRGTALNFTGTNSLSVNNSASLRMSGDITMIAWIYFKGYAQSTYAYILERGSNDIDNYAMYISNSGLGFECQRLGGGYVSYFDNKGAIPQNKWVQVAITFNDANNTLIFYRNATKTREIFSLTFQLNGTINNNLLIGSQNYGSYYFRFKGAMDEIMLFNRALSPTEITAIFNATKPW